MVGSISKLYWHVYERDILSWFSIGLTLVLGIPLIMLAYLGLKLIFRFKSPNNAVGLSLLAVWIVGLIVMIASAVSGFSGFKDVSTNTRQEIIATPSDTLYLKLGKDEFSDYLDDNIKLGNVRIANMNDKPFFVGGVGITDMNDKPFLVGTPELDIQRSESNSWGLVIKSKSRGHDQESAQRNSREIRYNVDQKDSLITFQPWYYVIPGQTSWHHQQVQITLKVPEGKTIYLNQDMTKILHDIANTSNTWDGDMVGKVLDHETGGAGRSKEEMMRMNG